MNKLNHTVITFDMAAFDEVVKDLRNARRALLDESNDATVVQKQLTTAQKAMEKAVRDNNIDEYNTQSGEVRKLMKKLGDGPKVHQDKFDSALNSLVDLTAPFVEGDETEAGSKIEAPALKVA